MSSETVGLPQLGPYQWCAGCESVSGLSISEYLIRRLGQCGVRHVFGIPGDYVLAFYALLENSALKTIGCTREDCAGFAADAYARLNGIGAVCVTYGVGGLSLCNSIAGAYAEKSPVVVISGAPGVAERSRDPLLHHRVGDFGTQFEVFRRLSVAATELTDPATAFREIDRVLDAVMRHKRPGYIELPRDLVTTVPGGGHVRTAVTQTSDPETLSEAVAEAVRRLAAARRPVILADVEMHRFGLQSQVVALAETSGIPIATTVLGKSVVSEVHPLFVGVYEGAMSRAEVTAFVEESDCVLLLGAYMTDMNLGIYTANLDPAHCILASSDSLRISHHNFQGVLLGDFVNGLIAARIKAPRRELPPQPRAGHGFQPRPAAPLTIVRLMARLNESLDDAMVVIADVGDALFAAADLVIHRQTEFLGSAYYASMGFAVPAALGAMTARPDLRAVVLVGDGAFQMTGMELSTIVRHGFAPIVIVLDNKGYGTERLLDREPHKFNDIHPWHYHKLPEVLGGGRGYEVRSEDEFDRALCAALADRSGMSLIQAHLGLDDCSQSLQRLGKRLRARVESTGGQ